MTGAVVAAALASLAAGIAGAGPAPAQQRLTRDQVVMALAAATAQAPADFTGKDLSGLDLSGVDFKRANLSRCRLVKTRFANAHPARSSSPSPCPMRSLRTPTSRAPSSTRP